MSQLINYNGQLFNLNGSLLANKFPIRDGLMLYVDSRIDASYPRTGTTVNDLSVSALSGTLVNGVEHTPNKYFSIDGVDDLIQIPVSGDATKTYTINCLARVTGGRVSSASQTYNRQTLFSLTNTNISDGRGYRTLAFQTWNSANEQLLYWRGNGSSSTYNIDYLSNINGGFGDFHLYTVVYDPDTTKFYLNGELVREVAYTLGNNGFNKVWIGTRYWNGSSFTDQPISGDFVFFQMYERELSQSEIQSIYSNVKQDYGKIIEDGLVLNLDADNYSSYFGSGTTWHDVSPSGNDGTLTNGPTFQSDPPALVFDGSNDYIDLGNLTLSGNLTIELTYSWNPGATGQDRIFGGNPGISDTQLAARFYNDSFDIWMRASVWDPFTNYLWYDTGVSTPDDGNIVRLTIVNDSTNSNVLVYKNGQLAATMSNRQFEFTTLSMCRPHVGLYGGYFPGKIYETSMYNRALTADEIEYNFNARRGRYGI